MGILESLIKHTPFYKSYKKYKQEHTIKAQEKLEAKYLPLRIQFYKQFINSGDLVFDVGANVGNRVEAFLKCNAKVIAIEPQPSCVEVLKQKFGHSITIENVGLSDKTGELEMQVFNDTTVSTFSKDYADKTKDRFKYSRWETTLKVPVTTLDKLIERYGIPVFCKIDVEGYELEVLKGLQKKIPCMSIEYCVPEMEVQLGECLAYWHNVAPKATFNYSVGENMVWALDGWKDYTTFNEHIKSKEFIKTSFGDIYIKSI